MLLLGYTRAVAAIFLSNGSHAHGVLTVILAVLAIFVIDFSINAGAWLAFLELLRLTRLQYKQWTGRYWSTRCRQRSRPRAMRAPRSCLALDPLWGSLCASRHFVPSPHLISFLSGNLPLQTLLPFLQAESELQALSVLVSVLLLACHGLTTALVKERVLLKTKGCVSSFILFYIGGFTLRADSSPLPLAAFLPLAL
jgi:solute carrier family 45 protein 1/2/4